ncbi:uncharacterized protein DS421_13g423160 [Arachis hypogaea]|nr:uncharacterized protein DS421_13g423160 [Arachis hypogaea]
MVGVMAVDEMATAMVVEENMEVVVAAEFVVVESIEHISSEKNRAVRKVGGVRWKSMSDANESEDSNKSRFEENDDDDDDDEEVMEL